MTADAGREPAFVEPAFGVLGAQPRAFTSNPAGATNASDRTATQRSPDAERPRRPDTPRRKTAAPRHRVLKP
jgi:hypothetical protein